jgi:hypothetical protein
LQLNGLDASGAHLFRRPLDRISARRESANPTPHLTIANFLAGATLVRKAYNGRHVNNDSLA